MVLVASDPLDQATTYGSNSWMTDSYLMTEKRRMEDAKTQMHPRVKYSTSLANADAAIGRVELAHQVFP